MKVLVIGAHPDDEAIGCGGMILKHAAQGDEIEVLLMTAGEKGCPGVSEEDTKLLRTHEAFEASAVLGSKVLSLWEQPDGSLQNSLELIELLAKTIAQRRPDVIYVTSDQDSHPDHKAAAQLLRSVMEKSILQPECWMYEVWTPLPVYDRKEDITAFIGPKLTAIRKHESQVNRIRFDEAALSLARFRGELHNRPHGPYAEVFKRL